MERTKADDVINTYFSHFKGRKILFFSMNNTYNLIIVKNETKYEHSYINFDTLQNDFRGVDHIGTRERDNLMIKAFNINNYCKDFIHIGSNFYENGVKKIIGSPTYFVL